MAGVAEVQASSRSPRGEITRMLLTITTTHRPATDLGYLLHKHPGAMPEL